MFVVAREDIKPGVLLYRSADAGNALQGDRTLTRDVDFIVGVEIIGTDDERHE